MDHTELNQLTGYIATNKGYFGNSNYHSCDPERAPEITEYDIYPARSSWNG